VAAATLCCHFIAVCTNQIDKSFEPEALDDFGLAQQLNSMSRKDEAELIEVSGRPFDKKLSLGTGETDRFCRLLDGLQTYTRLHTRQQLT